jgi:predicted DNA-binding protein (MmcQ/YjbR family)
MDLEMIRRYCLAKSDTTEEFPFDQRTAVYKVSGKMFALVDIHDVDSINVKCDPERAVELRETYESVRPGYHMNKKHWNTLLLDGTLTDRQILQWIDDSYNLVSSKVNPVRPKKARR